MRYKGQTIVLGKVLKFMNKFAPRQTYFKLSKESMAFAPYSIKYIAPYIKEVLHIFQD